MTAKRTSSLGLLYRPSRMRFAAEKDERWNYKDELSKIVDGLGTTDAAHSLMRDRALNATQKETRSSCSVFGRGLSRAKRDRTETWRRMLGPRWVEKRRSWQNDRRIRRCTGYQRSGDAGHATVTALDGCFVVSRKEDDDSSAMMILLLLLLLLSLALMSLMSSSSLLKEMRVANETQV